MSLFNHFNGFVSTPLPLGGGAGGGVISPLPLGGGARGGVIKSKIEIKNTKYL
jgi:hypothetical protein